MTRRRREAIPPDVIGWRVRRDRKVRGKLVTEYATGSRTWRPERRRGFLFTSWPSHARATGMSHGRTWAREHMRSLLEKPTDGARARLYIVRVRARKGRKG